MEVQFALSIKVLELHMQHLDVDQFEFSIDSQTTMTEEELVTYLAAAKDIVSGLITATQSTTQKE